MRTMAPNTTCANPINSAAYPILLSANTSARSRFPRYRSHLMRAVGHLHVMSARLDAMPRREQQEGKRDRGHHAPNQLRNRRASGNQIRMLRAPLREDRSQDRDLGHRACERGSPEDCLSQWLIH